MLLKVLVSVLFCSTSFAVVNSQMHLRTGALSASFSGGTTLTDQSFSLGNALDVELELHQTSQRSLSFRSIMGVDLSTADMRYFYAGVGSRHYFLSAGSYSETASMGTKVSIVPKMRHYFGLDLGIVNAQVKAIEGGVLSVQSALIEFGAGYGFIYQVSKNFGAQINLGFGFGYGFSSVTVTGSSMKMLLGMSYYF